MVGPFLQCWLLLVLCFIWVFFDFDVLLPERCDFHFFLTCRDYVVTDEVLTSGVGQPSQEVSGLQLVLLNGEGRNMLVRRITAYSEAFNPVDSTTGNHNCSWVNPASSGVYLFRNGAELPFSLTNSTEALGSNAADREDGCPFYDTGKKRNRYDIVFEYNLEEVPDVNYVSRVEGRLLASPSGGALLVPVPHPVCRSPPPSVSVCGRTIQVRQEILSQLSGSQPGITCDQVTSCQLRSIQTLDLESKHIAMLKVGDFDDLTSLQTLYLTNNPLTGLPNGIFHDLTNLQSIMFRKNSLTSLSSDLFDNNRKLRSLYLDANSLTSLPPGLFDSTLELRSLYLDADSLTSLPPGLFDSTLELRTLSLDAGSLTSLPPGLFDSTLELRTLFLHAGSLTSLPPGLFDSTLELRTLLLDAGSLTSLRRGVLDPLVYLNFFLIQSDSLTSLPPGLFDNNRELKRLSLWVDSLTSLPPDVFDTLVGLESLSLWSSLNSLATDVFDGLFALNSLSISDYHFSSFNHDFFANLNNLQYFGISSRSMSVSSLSIVLDHNPNIRALTFKHTFSFSLSRDVFDNTPDLDFLALGSGDSVSFSSDEVFYDLPKLDSIYFDGYGSVSLPSGIFANNDYLYILHARSPRDVGSRFSFSPDVFHGLDSLNFTAFYNLSLDPLPSGVFDTTPELRILVLQNADLDSLDPDVFDHLDNLEILDLSYNNLNSLPPNIFENLLNLKHLDTNNNRFGCIPREAFGSRMDGFSGITMRHPNNRVRVPITLCP